MWNISAFDVWPGTSAMEQFSILGHIGEGAHGIVFKAKQIEVTLLLTHVYSPTKENKTIFCCHLQSAVMCSLTDGKTKQILVQHHNVMRINNLLSLRKGVF